VKNKQTADCKQV